MEMTAAVDLIVWRAVERLLIVLIGAFSIYLGYRLFWSMREFTSDNEGNIELPGGISIHLSRVGPGVFFALFGAIIVGFSIVTPLNITTIPQPTKSSATKNIEHQAAAISYMTDTADVATQDQKRAAVLRDLNALSILDRVLSDAASNKTIKLSNQDATRALIVLPHIRQELLLSVWDPQQWGDKERFIRWIEQGRQTPPPAQNHIPAELLNPNQTMQ